MPGQNPALQVAQTMARLEQFRGRRAVCSQKLVDAWLLRAAFLLSLVLFLLAGTLAFGVVYSVLATSPQTAREGGGLSFLCLASGIALFFWRARRKRESQLDTRALQAELELLDDEILQAKAELENCYGQSGMRAI